MLVAGDLSNEMKEEEKKLREQKKQAKLDKAKAKEQVLNQFKNEGNQDKRDEAQKAKVCLFWECWGCEVIGGGGRRGEKDGGEGGFYG